MISSEHQNQQSSRLQLLQRPLTLHLTALSIALILGQFGRISLPQGRLYLHDLVILTWLMWWGVRQQSLRRQFFSFLERHRWSSALMVSFGALTLLNWLRVDTGGLTGALYSMRLGVYLAWAASLWLCVRKESDSGISSRLQFSVLSIAGGIAGLGLLQYLIMPDTRWLYFLGYDMHYYRLISTQFDPNFAGIIMGIGLLLLPALSRIPERIRVAAAAGLFIAIALTTSRSSYLSLVVGVLTLGVWHLVRHDATSLQRAIHRYRLEIGGSVLALCIVVLWLWWLQPGGEGLRLLRTASIDARLRYDAAIIRSLTPLDHVLGRGFFVPITPLERTLPIANNAVQPNNILVWLYSGGGVVGILLSGGILCTLRRQLWRQMQFIHPTQAAVLSAVLVHSCFNLSVLQPFVLLVLLLGMVTTAQSAPRV